MDIYKMLDYYRQRAGLTNQQVSNALGHEHESYYRVKMYRQSKFDLHELQQLIYLFNLSDEELIKMFKPNIRK